MDKNAFLGHIRRQIRQAHLPESAAERPVTPPPPVLTPDDLVVTFRHELVAVNGHCHVVEDDSAAMGVLLDLFEEVEVKSYLGWDDPLPSLPDLHDRLAARGYRRADTDLPREAQKRGHAQRALASATAGLTGALAGLADTGSIALLGGPGQGRLASLLPPVHMVLLHADRLLADLPALIAAYPDALSRSSQLVLITGPSRTADIEQTLTLGVHGPKALHVILIAPGHGSD